MNIFQRIKKFVKESEYEEKEEEKRYSIKPVLKIEKKEEFWKIFLETSKKTLELMEKTPNRARSMKYYDDIALSDKRLKEIEDFRKSGGKVIGTFCNLVPEELIYAAGAIPIRLCAGFYDTIYLAEEVLPKDICPLIKSSLGFKILGLPYFELCDVIAIPTACDGKKKLGEILSNYLPVWMLQLPNTKDTPQSKELWFIEVKLLKKRIEKLTGNKITADKFKLAIELLHKRTEVFRRFYEIRKSKKPVITERDALLVIQTSFYDDIRRWIEKTEKLCDELKGNIKKGKSVCDVKIPRLLLAGAPIIWPNYKLLNIIEEFGIVVTDEICSGTQQLYDTVEVDEWTMDGMLKAVAERYLLPSICPCFTRSDDRIDKLLQMREDFGVDGVIYHQLRLCQLYDIEFNKLKQIFESEGIPILRIQTDYSEEDVEQIRTRVEAFLELLRVRGKR
jgi:benzoyl-CoA reductase/2-hydroxyglutaryl-CoA dehydratase subunit BcrC/BadD/HgdB